MVFGQVGGFGPELNLDQLTPSEGFRVNGTGANDDSGWRVAGLGDVNGDGYDDLVVGAVTGDGLSGSAYILFGHAGAFDPDFSALDGSDGFRVNGLGAGQLLGESVASAGDINGDGFDDIIIGAPWENGSGGEYGTAYVLFGHAGSFDATVDVNNLTPSEGFSITRTSPWPYFGWSVSSAGDINGDGYADLIVGAVPGSISPVVAQSYDRNMDTAYVIFGHAGGFSNIDVATMYGAQGFAIHGAHAADYAGDSVSAAGDINGDGYADILVGAPMNDPHAAGTGAAYVIYGHAGGFSDIDLSKLDGTNGFVIDGLSSGDATGYSVAAAGDVNGDGFADLIVGAYGASPNGHSEAGSSYVIFGGNFTGSVLHLGTSGADTMTGSANTETFVGGGGNDVINGGGGKDSIEAGSGDDQIHVSDNTFQHIDGGSGTDTLHLDYAGTIDFGNLDGNAATSDRGKISNIETISADNGFNNAMTLHLADVLDMAPQDHAVGGNAPLNNVLKIDGNAGDTLHLSASDGWSATPDTSSLAGYAIYTDHAVHVAVETAIAVTVN